ncbi:MAG: hypothetical protein CL933_17565 [Deltaproteobacteria bacterium]|nr:hypothetical protein [Deltaproteobacteria bacterium]
MAARGSRLSARTRFPSTWSCATGVGSCFFFAGWVARWLDFIPWFGIIVGLSAFAVLFVGRKRLESYADRIGSFPRWVLRVRGLASLGLGALLAIGLQP